MGLPAPAADFPIKIRVSKSLPGSAAWHTAQKNIVQVIFVRWRGDSKIVEANAEHDFRLKRLIGMLRTTKRAQYSFVPYAKRRCQTDLLTPKTYRNPKITFYSPLSIMPAGKKLKPP